MFLSLAVRETYVTETNFAARKQETVFAQVKSSLAYRTQILLPKHMQFNHHDNNIDRFLVLLFKTFLSKDG